MYSTNIKKFREQRINPFILNIIKVWIKVGEVLNIMHSLSHFNLTKRNGCFRAKVRTGSVNNRLSKIDDLFNAAVMKLEELWAKFDVPNKHFFKVLQVRSFTADNSQPFVYSGDRYLQLLPW